MSVQAMSMQAPPLPEPYLKAVDHRVDELERLLGRALDIHAEASDVVASAPRWDAAANIQKLSEVLIGLIDIVRAQHGICDQPDEPVSREFAVS